MKARERELLEKAPPPDLPERLAPLPQNFDWQGGREREFRCMERNNPPLKSFTLRSADKAV